MTFGFMQITRAPISADAPFTLADVKLHARVDHPEDDAALSRMAWAAAREIEGLGNVALLSQSVTVTLDAWGLDLHLPIAPLWVDGAAGEHPITVEALAEDGTVSIVAGWHVLPGRWPALRLPTVTASQLRVTYPAGFGSTAASISEDLQLAICDQAARFYDARGADDVAQGLSPAAARIMARYRRVMA